MNQQPVWNAIAIPTDMKDILNSQENVLSCLCDLHCILVRARTACKRLAKEQDTSQQKLASEYKKLFASYERKVWYFLSWMTDKMCQDDITCNKILKQLSEQVMVVQTNWRQLEDTIDMNTERQSHHEAPVISVPSVSIGPIKSTLPNGQETKHSLITEL